MALVGTPASQLVDLMAAGVNSVDEAASPPSGACFPSMKRQ